MASWNSPAVARRWLAYELRRLREDKGLAQRDVGKACGWSGVKVSYLENAQQNVTDDDLDKLLPLYEVAESEWADFHTAAKAAREKGWWERYDDDVVPGYIAQFIGLEQGASLIRTPEPMVVPGLLQTRPYMEMTIGAGLTRRTGNLIGRIAEVRLARQEVITRQRDPADLVTVMDESVVRRVVGSAALMADQLRHIIEVSERPNVSVHIFPFERGISPGMVTASHRILHFAGGVDAVVYMETPEGAQWIEDSAQVEAHDLAFDQLVGTSLDVDESRELLRSAAEAFAERA